jgi:hypothetical protein
MREFFRGWRRKTGCATLVLACVSMLGWMRSREYVDIVTVFTRGNVTHFCVSDRECFKWIMTTAPVNRSAAAIPQLGLSTRKVSNLDADHSFAPIFSRAPDWRTNLSTAGFQIGDASFSVPGFGDYRASIVQVPYWSIVLPLTLLSAWLILSKPRSNQGK